MCIGLDSRIVTLAQQTRIGKREALRGTLREEHLVRNRRVRSEGNIAQSNNYY